MNPGFVKRTLRIVAIVLSGLMYGCMPQTITPRIEIRGDTKPTLDWTSWALVLSRCVVEDRIDYQKLIGQPGAMERTMAMLAVVGPQSTPAQFLRREERVAYYINAYNAAIVRSVLALEENGRIPRFAPWNLESRFQFKVDGELRTAAELHKLALREGGDDFRVRFALCDGRRSGPPLHPRPIIANLLDGQLNFVTRMALYSPHMLRIEIGGARRLVLWEGLYEERDRMIAEYERRMGTSNATILNVLGEWSNRKRRLFLNTAVGYIVTRMPTDDLINQVDPPPVDEGRLSLF